jgi:hypothetical protein
MNSIFHYARNPIIEKPTCSNQADVSSFDFQYFDKDGFELTLAEQKFYDAMGYPIHYEALNNRCWQEPWFFIDSNDKILLDHCLILHRADFSGYALEQLQQLKKHIPQASYLINCKRKWGFDFALDAVDSDGNCFEVIHIEYDCLEHNKFCEQLDKTEKQIYNIDWFDAAKRIEQHKDKWQHLKGFEQNHWKAEFLMNWSRAEYLEKTT